MTTKKTNTKPGYLTTEFYLSSGALILGIVIASGVVDPTGTGTWDKVVGMACSLFAALGYTVSRSQVKASGK